MSRPTDTAARRARFIAEFGRDPNAENAARRAGYAKHSARQIGCWLLRQPDVVAALAAQEDRRLSQCEATADRVLREALRIAFADLRRAFTDKGGLRELGEMDGDTAAALASITVRQGRSGRVNKVRLNSKVAALAMLCGHLELVRAGSTRSGR